MWQPWTSYGRRRFGSRGVNKALEGVVVIMENTGVDMRWSRAVTPLHPGAGGSVTDDGEKSHRLPLQPVTISNAFIYSFNFWFHIWNRSMNQTSMIGPNGSSLCRL